MIRRVVVVAAIAVAGCGSGATGTGFAGSGSGSSGEATDPHGHHGPGVYTGPRITGWEPGCAAALTEARTAPALDRFAILARGCPACGVDWAPLLRATTVTVNGTSATTTTEIDDLVKACGGACSGTARDQFINAFELIKDERTLERPWRTLAKACPALLAPSADGRLASAPWYLLTQISRAYFGHPGAGAPAGATVAVADAVELPLPAVMVGGGGVELPTASSVLPEPAAVLVTVLANEVRVAPAPTALLGPEGLSAPTLADYPGDPVAPHTLAKRISDAARTGTGTVAILAPHAAPARRVLEVIAATGAGLELHLGATTPTTASGWAQIPRLITPRLTPAVTAGDAVVIALGGGGRVGHLTGRAVTDGCAVGGEEVDAAAATALVTHAHLAAGATVIVTIDEDAITDDLAAVVDALGAAGVAVVTLAPPSQAAWPATTPPCS